MMISAILILGQDKNLLQFAQLTEVAHPERPDMLSVQGDKVKIRKRFAEPLEGALQFFRAWTVVVILVFAQQGGERRSA